MVTLACLYVLDEQVRIRRETVATYLQVLYSLSAGFSKENHEKEIQSHIGL
jgi:hypothetical protein